MYSFFRDNFAGRSFFFIIGGDLALPTGQLLLAFFPCPIAAALRRGQFYGFG